MKPLNSGDVSPLARKIRQRRLELGMTLAQAGALAGVSIVSVHKWETGQAVPRAGNRGG